MDQNTHSKVLVGKYFILKCNTQPTYMVRKKHILFVISKTWKAIKNSEKFK